MLTDQAIIAWNGILGKWGDLKALIGTDDYRRANADEIREYYATKFD